MIASQNSELFAQFLMFESILTILIERANGLRYPLVGGTRERHFAGTNSKSHKLLENAPSPTSRVHALLGGSLFFSSCIVANKIAE
jgi:hypothetical protein